MKKTTANGILENALSQLVSIFKDEWSRVERRLFTDIMSLDKKTPRMRELLRKRAEWERTYEAKHASRETDASV